MNLEEKMISREISQIIVTIAFFYSSIICHFKAMELFEEDKLLYALFLWLCSFTSFCGGLRFQIAKIIYKIKDLKKK
ncbi:MAG: hypothetical protein CBC25_08725 [Pelagibacteraceae bacterium TMED65]|nr:hypothetical protein [Rickettsiales bacterium]OUU50196.1 MAG: hypothetical protein CBC25_08725 [Pelagibacteraceae bacterium TMED65]|tara:strand:+ start:2343 stop:2573 length:231 start_codon:yes stop_codon:yes gene_type:complete